MTDDPVLIERKRCAMVTCRYCAQNFELKDGRHSIPTDLGGGTMRYVSLRCDAVRIWEPAQEAPGPTGTA